MALRDKVTLVFIFVVFYQCSCMPRRCKNNYAYKSRNPCPRYGKQINKPTPKIFYNKVVQKSPVPKLRCEIPKNVPEITNDVGLSQLCQNQKSKPEIKDCLKTPVADWDWEVPDVPDFEDSFDLSKQCLRPPSLCTKCKYSNSTTTAFDPFPEPYCFKEKGSFPEVDYPLDVNDFRIPNYWNDFIEKKLKQQGEDIDQACTKSQQIKSNPNPRPKNKAVEKAVNALLKSQENKAAKPSICPINESDKPSDLSKDEMASYDMEKQPVHNKAFSSTIGMEDKELGSDSSLPSTIFGSSTDPDEPPKDIVRNPTDVFAEAIQEDNCLSTEKSASSQINDNVPEIDISKPVKNIIIAQSLPDPIPNTMENVISKPIQNTIPQEITDPISIVENDVSKPIKDISVQALPDPVLENIISKPTENIDAQALTVPISNIDRGFYKTIEKVAPALPDPATPNLLQNVISTPIDSFGTEPEQKDEKSPKKSVQPPMQSKILDPMLELEMSDVIAMPIDDVTYKENKVQTLFHKTAATPREDIAISLKENIVSKPIKNDPASLDECSKNNCSPIYESPLKSGDTPSDSSNRVLIISSPDEVSDINSESNGQSLNELFTESESPRVDEFGVKKVLIDSLLAISNMNTSQKETIELLDPPADTTFAVGDDDFGFATMPPIDEEAPRVVRSCSKDPSLFLCPEDLDYIILASSSI